MTVQRFDLPSSFSTGCTRGTQRESCLLQRAATWPVLAGTRWTYGSENP
jgi:hypothetical protein